MQYLLRPDHTLYITGYAGSSLSGQDSVYVTSFETLAVPATVDEFASVVKAVKQGLLEVTDAALLLHMPLEELSVLLSWSELLIML